ncbi:MAG: 6-phosphogluconolactonase [Rickettsiales bacterium]
MTTMHQFSSRQEAAQTLAENVAEWLREGVTARGKASLVVSGGSTPKPFFEVLGNMDLPWESIYVTLADERWVPNTSEDSNEKLVRSHMKGLKHFVPLKNAAAIPAAGEKEAEAAIKPLLPFDVVILGMGEDGHTASLFPNHPGLEEGLKPGSDRMCLGVEDSPKPPPSRLTLTYAALINCQHLVIHISGNDKIQVLEKAQQASVNTMPIAAFLKQNQVPAKIYWAE